MKAIRKNTEFNNIQFSRKSTNWETVNILNRDEISEELYEQTENLTWVDSKEFPANVDGPVWTEFDQLFLEENDFVFVYKKDNEFYLIDTQGYNYARYIIKLIG